MSTTISRRTLMKTAGAAVGAALTAPALARGQNAQTATTPSVITSPPRDFGPGGEISAEHLMRRVVRYEHDGTITVIADSFEGKRLNSPNDVVAHRDGSIWFTDPPYGASLFQGQPDEPGGPTNAAGLLQPRVG